MKLRLIVLLNLLIAVQCTAKQEIDENYVSHIVKTLSADDMQGREAFATGADMAADFLVKEFEVTGVDKFPGLEGFKQNFDMFSLAINSVSIKLNDVEYSSEDMFTIADQEELKWGNLEEVKVLIVAESERLPDVFRQASAEEGDVLILVHTSHADMFARYKNYFGQGTRKFELDKEHDVVVVKTDLKQVDKIDINIKNEVKSESLTNVIGVIPGKRTDEIVLFSGHYDHIGYQKTVDGDSIANGANDDASGTAAVMALAKYFKNGAQPERTLYFVAFAAEEIGGFGSQYFSKQLDPDQIVAMFNLEMIGKPAVSGPNTAWITGFDKSDFGTLLQKSVEGTAYKFYADPYPDQNLFYRSDNATLARLGVPAHSISTTPIDVDKDYHQVTDEYETLDVVHMTNTIKAIAKAAEGMVAGELTPTRVDKSTID
jgi:Zn-dependent M28 family amino/carboxypeptidase